MVFQKGGEIKSPFQTGGEVGRQPLRPGIVSRPVDPQEEEQSRQLEFLRTGLGTGQIEPQDPTFLQRLKQDLPQIAGGTVGGLAGAKAGALGAARIPAGHPILKGATVLGGAVAGATLGGAGGKGFQQTFRMTRPGAVFKPLKELYTEQLIAGIEEGASELAGRGIAKGLGIAGRAIAKSRVGQAIGKKIISPGAKEAAKLLRESGLGITLAQATDNRMIDLMESIAEGSLVGGGRLQKLKTILIPKAIKKAVGSLSDDFAAGVGKLAPEETGELLLDTINRKNTAFKRASRSIYSQVDKLVKRSGAVGDIVDVTFLKKFAQSRLQSKVRVLRSVTGDTLLDSIVNLPDRITFKQASSLRSALLTQSRNMSVTKDVALGLTKQLTKMSDSAIDKAGRQLAPEALAMKRFADNFHRTGKEVFNSKIIRGLSRNLADNPEIATRKIFQKGATKQIKLIKNTVDPPTWDALKHSYVESILDRAKSPTGDFVGTKFLNQLDDEVLKATFSPAEISSLKTLGNAAELLQRPTAPFAATGKLVVAIAQAGAITGSAFARRPGQAGAILFTPYAFARIATNKRWSRLLIEGMKNPVKSSVGLARLGRIAAKLDLDNLRRKQNEVLKDIRTRPVPEPRLLGGFKR